MHVVQPVLKFKSLLGLKSIGIEYGTGNTDSMGGEADVIHLLKSKPSASTKFRYLVISENYHDLVSKDVDLVGITSIDEQFYEESRLLLAGCVRPTVINLQRILHLSNQFTISHRNMVIS
jgi:hypothetical protein